MEDCTPLSAPTAAHCEGAAGPEVSCDWMLVMARTSSLLPTVQPMRKPVMAYIFETQLMTTSLDLSISSWAEVVTVGGRFAVEDQPVVGVVHDQVEDFFSHNSTTPAMKSSRVHRARGVVGAVENDGLGVAADVRRSLHGGLEAAVRGLHGTGTPPASFTISG
jgi:hypothetical protein